MNFGFGPYDNFVDDQIKKARLLQEVTYRKQKTTKITLDDVLTMILMIRKAKFPQDLGIIRH